jgi:hypothetical protein
VVLVPTAAVWMVSRLVAVAETIGVPPHLESMSICSYCDTIAGYRSDSGQNFLPICTNLR